MGDKTEMIIYSVVLFVGIVFGILLCWFFCPKEGKPCIFGDLFGGSNGGTCGTCSNGGTCDCTNKVTTTTTPTSDNCLTGETECDGVCIDIQDDADNCGSCGNECRTGFACCSGVCVDLQTDFYNCYRCDDPCMAGQTCIDGVCVSGANPTNCAQTCYNYASIYTQYDTATTYTECRNLFYKACGTEPGTFQVVGNNCCCWYC
jgi:hypothetical protein